MNKLVAQMKQVRLDSLTASSRGPLQGGSGYICISIHLSLCIYVYIYEVVIHLSSRVFEMEARGPQKDMDIFLEVPRFRIGILGLDFSVQESDSGTLEGFPLADLGAWKGGRQGRSQRGPGPPAEDPCDGGAPGPLTDGPPVSCPVSCPVSTGGFKPGFMGGLGRLVFRSWFHGRFHARFHGA